MTERAERLLEFDKIRREVAMCAVSDCARAAIESDELPFDRAAVTRNLALTAEADLMLNKYRLDPIAGFDDVAPQLEKADKGSALSMGELLRVARLLRSARIAVTTLERAPEEITYLRQLTEGVRTDAALEKDIFDCILSENEMSDNASDKLYYARRRIRELNARLKEKLMSYTRNNESSKYLRDNLVTIREGRYVLPVKAECRSDVAGIVHDRSATGSTVFVEPFAIVELNNDLRLALSEEQEEVERILADFSRRISLFSDALKVCQQSCTMLDTVFSKIKFSVKINGILPKIAQNREVRLLNSRHPLIAKEKVVPVDITIPADKPLLIISGPNTGGKTVCLKTVGLLTMMAYFGLYLPCSEASVCVYDGIFCDIGDEQSIENELSTFSMHVKCLIDITRGMTANSMVLLDEPGRGTDPTEGAALAVGIVKFIERVGATAVLTTHFGALKDYALSSPRAENACMQFDDATLMPTFRLITGMPGSSNALGISGRLGLDPAIIRDAQDNLGAEKLSYERVLRSAERLKNESLAELERSKALNEELERSRRALAAEREKLGAAMEKIRRNAAAETKRLASAALMRANEIVDEMKERLAEADEAALMRARTLRNELEGLSYEISDGDEERAEYVDIPESELAVGQSVIVKSLNAPAVVRALNPRRKQANVQMGNVKTDVKYSDLAKPLSARAPDKAARAVPPPRAASGSDGFTEREVMVLGMTVAEAVEEIEPYLRSMSEGNGAKVLRVVHGKGTGRLGKGIQQYLKGSPFVAEFRYGRYGEGDNGVTIVTVK